MFKAEDFFVEWAPTVKGRKGMMLKLSAIDNLKYLNDTGYRSVYMFSKEHADEIKTNGHSRGFNQYPVAAQELTIDIDGGQEAAKEVFKLLKPTGLAFDIYVSGGKGYHFVIPHQLEYSKSVPYSHLAYIKSLLPETLYDKTLYQPGRLISLPGRLHPVTGKKKVKVFSVEGSPLNLEIVEEPVKVSPVFYSSPETDAEMLASALMRLVDLVTYPPDAGKRHIRIWGVSRDLALAGVPFPCTLELLTQVNETWQNQKSSSELEQAVKKAYQGVGS